MTIATLIIKDEADSSYTIEGSLDRPEALRRGLTGVDLKDESDLALLAGANATLTQICDDRIA